MKENAFSSISFKPKKEKSEALVINQENARKEFILFKWEKN